MKASGFLICGTDKGSRSGQMDPNMRETGPMTKQTGKANYSMQTAMFMRENGEKTKPTGREPTFIKTGRSTVEIGETTNNMGLGMSPGLMELFMREVTRKERNMERANLPSQTAHFITAISK
jgi:hypothetical protein